MEVEATLGVSLSHVDSHAQAVTITAMVPQAKAYTLCPDTTTVALLEFKTLAKN